MKLSRWVVPFLVLLLLGGAGYYVVGIAWPVRYAKRALAFERDMKRGPSPNESLAARLSENDPAATRELLQIQQTFVDRLTAGAKTLRPAPPQYWSLQRDLERSTELLRLNHERAVRSLGVQQTVAPGAFVELLDASPYKQEFLEITARLATAFEEIKRQYPP